MAEELVLNPKDFQKEIDQFESKNKSIGTLKYEINTDGLYLDTFDTVQECIATINGIIEKIHTLGVGEVNNLQNIKSTWMNLDEEIGKKNLAERIFNK